MPLIHRALVAPPSIDQLGVLAGLGSGDGTVTADPWQEVRYAGVLTRVTHPGWYRYAAATGTGVNRYLDPVNGNDANDGLTTATAKRTFDAVWTDCNTGDAANRDCVNILSGTIADEGDRLGMQKSVIVQGYAGATVVFDPRATLGPWTDELVLAPGTGAVLGTVRWAAYACAHTPSINSKQAGIDSTSATFANTDPTWVADPDSVANLAVTRDDVVVLPAASGSVTSLTRSGTTATATTATDHGLATGDTVSITNLDEDNAGVDYTAYQQVTAVTVTGARTFTYPVAGSPATPAVGEDPATVGIRWTSHRQCAGTEHFFHDNVRGRLYVGFDPTGRVVKAPTKMLLWSFSGSPTVTIRNVVATCYAGRYGDTTYKAIVVFGSTVVHTVENCAFGFSEADGVSDAGASAKTHRHNTFVWIRTGLSAGGNTQNVDARRLYGRLLNMGLGRRPRSGWHGGGTKYVGVGVASCWTSESDFRYVNGGALWGDFAGDDMRFVNNLTVGNVKFAVSMEVNTAAVGAESMCVGNMIPDAYWALGCSGSAGMEYRNNGTHRAGVDLRAFDDARAPQNIGRLSVNNNVFAAGAGSTLPGMSKQAMVYTDGTTAGVGSTNAEAWFTSFDRNYWSYPTAAQAIAVKGWSSWTRAGGVTEVVSDRPTWRTDYGLDASGVYTERPGDEFYVDAANGDYRPSGRVYAGVVLSPRAAGAAGPAYGLASVAAPRAGPLWYPGIIPGGLSFQHSFTLADSAVSTGTPETRQAPTAHAGTHGVSGNKLYSVTDANLDCVSWDAGARNCWVGAAVEGRLEAGNARIPCLWFAGDATGVNGLYIRLQNGTLSIRTVLAGVHTTVATASGLTTANSTQYLVKVKKDKDAITVRLDGVQVLSYALTAAEFAAVGNGTRVGGMLLVSGTPGGVILGRMDDLWVARL